MEQQNLQDKILGIIDTATEEKQRWDDLTPTDPDYMMHSPKSVGYHETNEQLYLFQNLLVGFTPSQSILDIGSGRGDMCNFITEFFGELAPWTGIDHNPIMADLALEKYGYNTTIGAFETAKLNVFTLSNYENLLQKAVDKQYVSENELETLSAWNANPAEWSEEV